jgi:3'-phosphoadenosine 5'-phosphosulfate sulfotransferase (PAPS reductase)/FAD synthetase
VIEGLDPAYAELPRAEALLRDAFDVLDEAEADHQPVKRWALFSGGHDSLTACAVAFAWAAERGLEMEAAHLRTGTGVPQTLEYVELVAHQQGWPLTIFDPPVPYADIVREHGFPGPGQHGLMYARLKERPLRELVRQSKTAFSDRVMLVTGARSDESQRRMRHVERITRDGAQLWTAAIWNWSKIDCANYAFKRRELPRSPVVDIMHMSGECRCGAFARPGELAEWMAWFPEETQWITDLQEEIAAAGVQAYRWGERPPRIHREQMAIAFGDDWDAGTPGILCVGCGPDEDKHDEEAEAA